MLHHHENSECGTACDERLSAFCSSCSYRQVTNVSARFSMGYAGQVIVGIEVEKTLELVVVLLPLLLLLMLLVLLL